MLPYKIFMLLEKNDMIMGLDLFLNLPISVFYHKY